MATTLHDEDLVEDILPFAALPGSSDAYFGVCPECQHHDGFLDIGQGHWFVCHLDRTKWNVGDNIFGTWEIETEADWTRNATRIADYREVMDNPEYESRPAGMRST